MPAHQALIHPPGAKKSELADGEPLKGGSPVSQLLLCSAAADRPNDLAVKPNVGECWEGLRQPVISRLSSRSFPMC